MNDFVGKVKRRLYSDSGLPDRKKVCENLEQFETEIDEMESQMSGVVNRSVPTDGDEGSSDVIENDGTTELKMSEGVY